MPSGEMESERIAATKEESRVDQPPFPSTSFNKIDSATHKRIGRRTRVSGSISLPAAPALLDFYIYRLTTMFDFMGKTFSEKEKEHLKTLIEPRVQSAWEVSPHGRLIITWESEAPPGSGIDYTVKCESGTTAEQYAEWRETHEAPLFGKNEDAKMVKVAEEHLLPAREHAILDIGAGTGRNALPMAKKGYKVTALELTPEFAKLIEEKAKAADVSSSVQVVQADILASSPDLFPQHNFSLIVCSEVTPHFRSAAHLRLLFERSSTWLRPGGFLLFNAFVSTDGYEPTEFHRQVGQLTWSGFFTPSEITSSSSGLAFTKVSEEQVHAFEKDNQPGEDWPPTAWFEEWSKGWDCFGMEEGEMPPMELRWLLFKKDGVRDVGTVVVGGTGREGAEATSTSAASL